MEISIYLASNYLICKHLASRVHGNFHVPCNETYALARYMAISMYLEMKHIARYMEISMYLANETYGKVHGHFDTLPYVSLQGTLSVVLRKSIRKFLVTVYPCCPKKHGNFRTPLLKYKRTLKRFIVHISQ